MQGCVEQRTQRRRIWWLRRMNCRGFSRTCVREIRGTGRQKSCIAKAILFPLIHFAISLDSEEMCVSDVGKLV